MIPVYPIFLDLTRRRIVIVGGGVVASRKAAGVLAAGAKTVRAVAPKFVRDFPAEAEKIVQSFVPDHLQGANLVFAATDSAAVNDAVVAEARQRGILVGRVDGEEDDPGDFITPALLRCGAITVAVSAGGSAALAAALRDALADGVGDEWVNRAEALRELRPRIKAAGIPIARRREIFRALAGREAAAALAEGGMASLCRWVKERFADVPLNIDEGGKA